MTCVQTLEVSKDAHVRIDGYMVVASGRQSSLPIMRRTIA